MAHLNRHPHIPQLLEILRNIRQVYLNQNSSLLIALQRIKGDPTLTETSVNRARRSAFGARKDEPEKVVITEGEKQTRASRLGPKHPTKPGVDHLAPQADILVSKAYARPPCMHLTWL